MTLRPDQLVRWSKPERRYTRYGIKMVSEAVPNAALKKAWKDDPDALRAAGIYIERMTKRGLWVSRAVWYRAE